jgi:PAS domain S-box-containing protein
MDSQTAILIAAVALTGGAAVTFAIQLEKSKKVIAELSADLAEAARQEKALIDYSLDVICTMDAGGKFTSVSKSAKKIWGFDPQELIGRPYMELVHPEDRAGQAINVGAHSFAAPYENRVERKDGKIIYVRWAFYWSETGQNLYCVARDITERKTAENLLKESENRMRSIIEHMPVGLLIVNEQGKIETTNPKAREIFGFNPKEMNEKKLGTLISGAGNDADTLTEILQKGYARLVDMEAIRKSGEEFPIELSLSDFKSAEGTRYLASIQDITERHEVERLKREFTSMVTHDLRTPLTSILAFLNILDAGAFGELSEKGREKIAVAERNVGRLVQLVNDLLDIEKLDSGMFKLDFADVKISNMIERSIESVRALAEQNEIKIESTIQDGEVTADGDRLVQVVVNLLSNALKFSPPGSTIDVSAQKAGDSIEVAVRDRGRGVPKEHQESIFERFSQVQTADGRRGIGTGLGLALCKAIVEAHHGTIGVDSDGTNGSRFWFRIPEPARIGAPENS